jgi:two-component system sensor histidine kinase MprB
MSFRLRLTTLATLAVAVGIAAASVVVYYTARSQLRGDADRDLRARAAVITAIPATGSRPRLATLPWLVISRRVERANPDAPVYIQVNAPRFNLKPQKPLRPLSVPSATSVRRAGEVWRTVNQGGASYRVLALKYGNGVVQIARPLSDINSSLNHLQFVLAMVSLGGIALAALLGLIVARAAVAPLRKLIAAADYVIGTRDLRARIGSRGGRDELARLSDRFDAMLGALEQSALAQRQLVQDASHELRTPIAALRANVELLLSRNKDSSDEREELRPHIERQLERVSSLLTELLELARGEETDVPMGEVRLDQLVGEVVESARIRAQDLTFSAELNPCALYGSKERIERAISNVIDNACKWSPPGSTVDVSVCDCVVEVRDRGPGVASADKDFIFDRFYRSDLARGTPGAGLGLAIVKQVVEAHGGRVSLTEAEGGGAVFRLEFPANGSRAASADSSLVDLPKSEQGLGPAGRRR